MTTIGPLVYTDGKAEGIYAHAPDEVPGILAEHGVCILPGVLSPEECAEVNAEAAAFFARITKHLKAPFDIADRATYPTLLQLEPHHGGLFQHHGIGHAAHVYKVRQNPNVVKPFAHIWSVRPEDLVSSFDGATYHTGGTVYNGHKKLHLDQGFGDTKGQFVCVQGLVTANPIEPGDGTFRFLLDSHRFHAEYADHFGFTEKDSKNNWHVVSSKKETPQLAWYLERTVERCAVVPAGGMVLWDSRTVHSGVEPTKFQRIRNVVYTCYLPRHRCTPASLAKRRKVLTDPTSNLYARTFSHYPDNLRAFSKYPNPFTRPFPTKDEILARWSPVDVPPPAIHTLTPLGRSLMGLD